MVQDIIVEAISRKKVALVVDRVDGPVLPELFGGEHQDAIIAQLVVFDDGQRLERLTQAHAVCNDAAIVALKLVDSAENTILLKLVELVPDECVFEAGLRPDDALLIDLFNEVPENVEEGDEVKEVGRLVRGEKVEALKHRILGVAHGGRIVPDCLEPVEQLFRRFRVFRHRVHREAVGSNNAKASGGEVRCSGDGHRFASGRLNMENVLSDRCSRELPDLSLLPHPIRALGGDALEVQLVLQANLFSHPGQSQRKSSIRARQKDAQVLNLAEL